MTGRGYGGGGYLELCLSSGDSECISKPRWASFILRRLVKQFPSGRMIFFPSTWMIFGGAWRITRRGSMKCSATAKGTAVLSSWVPAGWFSGYWASFHPSKVSAWILCLFGQLVHSLFQVIHSTLIWLMQIVDSVFLHALLLPKFLRTLCISHTEDIFFLFVREVNPANSVLVWWHRFVL